MPGKGFLKPFTHPQEFLCLYLDLSRLAVILPHCRLVDKHACIREHQALALSACSKEDSRSRGRLPEAYGLHIRLDVLHGVVDGSHGSHGTARRIDVQDNIAVRVLAFKHEELGHNIICRCVIDLYPHKNDPVLEQLRIGVGTFVSKRCFFLKLRHHVPRLRYACCCAGWSRKPLCAGNELCFFRCHIYLPCLSAVMDPGVVTILSTNPYSRAC